MNDFRPDRAPLDAQADAECDARIDALLTEFFRGEVPAILPDPAGPHEVATLAAAKPDFGVKFLWWGSGLAAAAVLGVFLWSKRPGNIEVANTPWPLPNRVETILGGPAPYASDVAPTWRPAQVDLHSEWREVGGRRFNATVADGAALLDVRAHRTPTGALYEQRTRLDWTSVRLLEPTTGEWIEATVPQLRVEVTRLDGQ